MLNRPPELEEFYKRHGKPLEVGMPVLVVGDEDFENEYVVFEIKYHHTSKEIYVSVSTSLNDYTEWTYQISPLDLTPVL